MCDRNCADFFVKNCEDTLLSDYGCNDPNKYYKESKCVDKMSCGCLNLNTTKYIPSGTSQTTGCQTWYVNNNIHNS
jgi:hypothetical protein